MRKLLLTALFVLVLMTAFTTIAYAQDSYEGVVTTDVLNVRSMGMTNSDLLGQVYYGDILKIIGVDNAWYKIDFEGMAAFVCGDYVSVTGGETAKSYNRQRGEMVVETAKKYIGTPYAYGGMSPSGFDCSGFVKYIYSQYDVDLYRTAAGQSNNGYVISKDELRPGDLVFFATDYSGRISHSGIYVGDGNFIHSPKPGQRVEIITMSSGYYASTYVCARRIFY